MSYKRLNYGRHNIDSDDIEAVVSVLKSDFLTQGPTVVRFENAIADRVCAKHAVAFSSGTAALHGAAWAAGVHEGDTGITQAITFCASANMIRYCGGNVLFADIEEDSLNMCPSSLERTIKTAEQTGDKVKVVVPVHMGGLSVNAAAIREIADTRIVIEDAAHSLGSTYEDGRPVGCGAYSDITVFSFHPVKPITTAEGGVAVTNNDELAARMRQFRNHGIEKEPCNFSHSQFEFGNAMAGLWYYEQQYLGLNYRLSDVHAALGLAQLQKIDKFKQKRGELVKEYDRAFANHNIIQPLQSRQDWRDNSAHHLYTIWIDYEALGYSRDKIMRDLLELGIGTQVHYIPIYKHPYYRELSTLNDEKGLHNSEKYYAGTLTLPLQPGMTKEDITFVVSSLDKLISNIC